MLLYDIVKESFFSNSLEKDIEAVRSTSFIDILDILGEHDWIARLKGLPESEKPADAILELREYFNHPADVSLQIEGAPEVLLTTGSYGSISSLDEQSVISGQFHIIQTGTYQLDLRLAGLKTGHTRNVFNLRPQYIGENQICIHYTVLVEQSLLYQGEQVETITLSISGSRVQYKIRIRPEAGESGSLLDKCRTYEELRTLHNAEPEILPRLLNTLDEPGNPLMAWNEARGFEAWPLKIAARIQAERKSVSEKEQKGEAEADRKGEAEAGRMGEAGTGGKGEAEAGGKGEAETGRKGEAVAGRKDDVQAGVNALFCLTGLPNGSYKPENTSAIPRQPVERIIPRKRYEYRDIGLIAGIKEPVVRSLGISNRGLSAYRLFNRTYLLRTPFFRAENITGVSFFNGKRFVYYMYRLRKEKQKDSFYFKERLPYNWREDLYKILRTLRLYYLTCKDLTKPERKKMTMDIIGACRRILAHMPGNSIPSRLTIRLVLMARLNSIGSRLWFWHLVPLLRDWDVADIAYTIRQFKFLHQYREAMPESGIPIEWYIANASDSSIVLSQLRQRLAADPVPFLRSMLHTLKASDEINSGLKGVIWDRYRTVLNECAFNNEEMELLVANLFKKTHPDFGAEIRIMLWRMMPNPLTAQCFLMNMNECHFKKEHFLDYEAIICNAGVKDWRRNGFLKQVLCYLPSVNVPDKAFVELLINSNRIRSPYPGLFNDKLDDNRFFSRLNRCRVISSHLADVCETRLINARWPWTLQACIASIRLSRLYTVSLDELARKKALKGPVWIRFCYNDKTADSEPIAIWPGRPVLCFMDKPNPSAVWIDSLNKAFDTRSVYIKERKLHPTIALILDSHLHDQGALLFRYMEELAGMPEDELDSFWPYIHTALYKIIRLAVYCSSPTIEEKIRRGLPGINLGTAGKLVLRLMRCYRPQYHLDVIHTLYNLMEPGENEWIRMELLDFIIRLDLDKLMAKDIDGSEKVILSKALKFQNEYNRGELDELRFRDFVDKQAILHGKPVPVLSRLCLNLLKDTALYYPYGSYLVKYWSQQPEDITGDKETVRYLMQTTDDHEFQLEQYQSKGEYGPVCIRTLAQAWEQKKQLTPVITGYLCRLIYRKDHKDMAMILDLMEAFYRENQNRYLFLHELNYQWQYRNEPIHEAYKTQLESLRYKDLLALLQNHGHHGDA